MTNNTPSKSNSTNTGTYSSNSPRSLQSDYQIIRWLLHLLPRKVLVAIAVVIVAELLLGASGVFNALFLRSIVDNAVAQNRDAFFIAAAKFAILVLLQITGSALCRFLREYSRATCENKLKEQEYKWLMEKDYEEVTATHTGEWINRLTSDTVVVADGMTDILPGLAFMVAKLLSASITLILLLPEILIIVVVTGGLFLFFSGYFRTILKTMHKRIQEADGNLRVAMQEQLESMLVIRAFSQEEAAQEQVRGKMALHRQARLRRSNVSNFFNVGYQVLMNGAYVLASVYCGYLILSGRMSYGTFTAVLQLVGQVQSPFASISGYLPRFFTMLASAERLQEASHLPDSAQLAGSMVRPAEPATGSQAQSAEPASTTTQPDQAEPATASEEIQSQPTRDFSEIRLDDITFRYLERGSKKRGDTVLSHFTCHIRQGEYIALIGPSGSGKSTILKILMCLYTPESGTRTIDGRPLEERCRGLFAYVPQGNQLMSGTIREVLSFGNQKLMQEDSKMWEALRVACAETFVLGELPAGLDTLLGERGAGLSEGQMQRIAIARAIFSGSPVLLPDEATSALDAPTEKQLLENLRAMTDRTVVIVTHRPMALQMTDRIVDLSNPDGAADDRSRSESGS